GAAATGPPSAPAEVPVVWAPSGPQVAAAKKPRRRPQHRGRAL
ncbi:hypothetical protein V3C99_005320, partial [Haemonchus contortus]